MSKSKKYRVDKKSIKQVHKNLKSLYEDIIGLEESTLPIHDRVFSGIYKPIPHLNLDRLSFNK